MYIISSILWRITYYYIISSVNTLVPTQTICMRIFDKMNKWFGVRNYNYNGARNTEFAVDTGFDEDTKYTLHNIIAYVTTFNSA